MDGWDCHVHVFARGPSAPGAHYELVERPLTAIEPLAAAHGIGHLVLVQPSVYGADNSLLLRALAVEPGRHRGVVVVHGTEPDTQWQAWHAAGVRGVRFNLVSPVGTAREGAYATLQVISPRLRAFGWHVQWYAAAADLPTLARHQDACGLPFVLDHLAGMTAQAAGDARAWDAVARLADGGAWSKLSGWYRLQSSTPHEDLLPVVRRLHQLFGERLVWGSDWPHTSFAPGALPPYAQTWDPVPLALGAEAAARVRQAGGRLYA